MGRTTEMGGDLFDLHQHISQSAESRFSVVLRRLTNKPDLVEEMDRSHNTAVTKATDKWLPNPEKKHSPLVKTYSIFNEYQKKFMERRQASTD